MVRTQKFDLDTDTTLGGNNASDYIAPSQKAIKNYVDNHSGGGGITVDSALSTTSENPVQNKVITQALEDNKEVFIAEYGTTSYADVLAAYNAGKTIVLKIPHNDDIYYTTEYNFFQNEFWFHLIIGHKKYVYTCVRFGYWDSWEYGNDIWDVQINGNSIVNNAEANILTNSAYSSNNKIATMNDLPAEQVQANWNETDSTSKAYIQNKPNLAIVATSGSYNDLSNKPTIPDTSTLANTSLSNLTSTGNNLVNTALNTRDNSTRLKFWTGTKAQYDAIATKDSNTLYNITDDQDITLTLLQTIYPVGSVYLSTNSTCPLASLFGTWTLVSSGRALWTGTGSNGGSTIEAGLPNITGALSGMTKIYWNSGVGSGALNKNSVTGKYGPGSESNTTSNGFNFDASQSNPIYGNSTTVQPPAYVVNVWRRTA